MRNGRHGLLLLVALIGVCFTFSVASAQAAPASAAAARGGKLSVGVEVLRFSTSGSKIKAIGRVTGKLTDNLGNTSVVRSQIALTARSGGGCKVLHLDLKQLNLKLLGLHAHLDRVVLNVTGKRRGGVLGVLFCRLAHAKVASARAASARALNSAMRHNRISGHAVRFSAYLTPQTTTSQAAGASCPVLDLVVGPLDVQLLGLVVDLQKVHLSITAVRSEGKVGDLFCGLANQ